MEFSLIRYNSTCKDMIIRVLQEIVKCTMHSIVLTRLDFYRMDTHGSMIVNQKIHLTLLTIVVVKKLMSMGTKFLCNNAFIYRTEIDATDIVEHRSDVVVIKQSGKQSYVIQIQLQKVLLQRLTQREMRIRYGMYSQGNAR